MNSKGHLIMSLIKSGIRILACGGVVVYNSLEILAIGFGLAEVLGIVEELLDKRG